MERQIKFRGKRTDTGEWAFGSLVKLDIGYIILINEKIESDNTLSPKNCIVFSEEEIAVVIPDTVGQFTGLLDKNGGEIYEGDIIRVDTYTNNGQGETYEFRDVFTVEELKGKQWYDFISEVKFNEGGFYLSEYSEGDTSLCILFGDMRHSFPMFECELIVNIHDNPELLKGGKE